MKDDNIFVCVARRTLTEIRRNARPGMLDVPLHVVIDSTGVTEKKPWSRHIRCYFRPNGVITITRDLTSGKEINIDVDEPRALELVVSVIRTSVAGLTTARLRPPSPDASPIGGRTRRAARERFRREFDRLISEIAPYGALYAAHNALRRACDCAAADLSAALTSPYHFAATYYRKAVVWMLRRAVFAGPQGIGARELVPRLLLMHRSLTPGAEVHPESVLNALTTMSNEGTSAGLEYVLSLADSFDCVFVRQATPGGRAEPVYRMTTDGLVLAAVFDSHMTKVANEMVLIGENNTWAPCIVTIEHTPGTVGFRQLVVDIRRLGLLSIFRSPLIFPDGTVPPSPSVTLRLSDDFVSSIMSKIEAEWGSIPLRCGVAFDLRHLRITSVVVGHNIELRADGLLDDPVEQFDATPLLMAGVRPLGQVPRSTILCAQNALEDAIDDVELYGSRHRHGAVYVSEVEADYIKRATGIYPNTVLDYLNAISEMARRAESDADPEDYTSDSFNELEFWYEGRLSRVAVSGGADKLFLLDYHQSRRVLTGWGTAAPGSLAALRLPTTIGVELELAVDGVDDVIPKLLPELRSVLGAPRAVYAERDGSLSDAFGFELVFGWASLADWQRVGPKLMRILRKAGAVSPSGPCQGLVDPASLCYGLHVNVAIDDDRTAWQRMTDFFSQEPTMYLDALVGRPENTYCDRVPCTSENHYAAVSFNSNDHIVSFRAFASTTDAGQFLAAIELCSALTLAFKSAPGGTSDTYRCGDYAPMLLKFLTENASDYMNILRRAWRVSGGCESTSGLSWLPTWDEVSHVLLVKKKIAA